MSIDWKSFTDEAINYLQQYIRIDTTNLLGNEIKGAVFLQSILTKEGISYKLVAHPNYPNRTNLIARVNGNGSKKPLLLMNHIDVVPAKADDWSFNPFGGDIINNYICGRGTLDMKGMTIVELMALIALKRSSATLNRDIILCCVADEEAGGTYGAQYIINNHWDLVDCEYALGEIGFGMEDYRKDGETLFLVQTGEKGIAQFKVITKGIAGHASIPAADNPVEALINALYLIMQAPIRKEILPTIKRFFWELAQKDGITVPSDYRSIPLKTIQKLISESHLKNRTSFQAALQDTIAVTVLKGGYLENVIPADAEAWIDCRILPGLTPSEFINLITQSALRANPSLQIEPHNIYSANESPIDTELFEIIKGTIEDYYPQHIVVPTYFPGATDLRHFRARGVLCYGIEPFIINDTEMATIHGKNERIHLDNIRNGTRIMFELLNRIAC
jgi:acetylornithine deacetylase/succinyl-diaminopimelate desuccinylase-like protein